MGKKDLRINQLFRILKENGSMQVADLSEQLHVSLMTIRRDLNELQDAGLVGRRYGKVTIVDSGSGVSYENIENLYTLHGESEKMYEQKRRIGRYAGGLIQPGEVVILDNGSTMDLLADSLPVGEELTVACFNLNILQKLWNQPQVHLLMAGGYFHRGDMMFESQQGVQFLQTIRANKVFVSASGVHEKLGLTCAHNYEVTVKQAILQSALQKVLLVDSSKFGTIKTVFFSQLGDVDMIVTDDGITPEWRELIQGKGIDLRVV